MPKTIFVSGAGSGLGKAFCHAYAAHDPSCTLYVLDRAFPTPSPSSPFLGLPQPSEWIEDHVIPIVCDITDPTAIAQKIGKLDLQLDLVIHSVGVRGLVPSVQLREYKDVAKAETIDVMDAETLRRTFEVNTVGTFLLLRALLPLLRRSKPISESETASGPDGQSERVRRPKVVVMGSRMGSVGHNTQLGGAYAYRASKAALNAVIKSFSIDIPDVIWTVMHPGRVETGLVSIKEDDAMDANEVVTGLLPLVDGFTLKDSGRFVDRFGVDIPW